MASYMIDGIKLRIPGRCLTPDLVKALESGRYERHERAALASHLRPDDRVLDLGAGAGCVSVVAARKVGGDNVTSVEASPLMMDVLRHNLDGNGAKGTTILNGAVVPDSHAGADVDFHLRKAFWASEIAATDGLAAPKKLQKVPALRLSDLLRRYRPSVVTMDIEGAEAPLCQQDWPDHVRLLIMEIHSRKYPPATIKAMFDGLSRAGMTYMPWGSCAEVVVLQRVPAAQSLPN